MIQDQARPVQIGRVFVISIVLLVAGENQSYE